MTVIQIGNQNHIWKNKVVGVAVKADILLQLAIIYMKILICTEGLTLQ